MSPDHAPVYELLGIYAAALDDIERARIAAQNRLRDIEQNRSDDLYAVHVENLSSHLGYVMAAEEDATADLEHAMKSCPLYSYVKRTAGLGLKQMGRLLGAIGDPATRPAIVDLDTGEVLENERLRRGPAELWQYCGHGDPERSRLRKGQKVEFSPAAKMRLHLVAESAVKAGIRKLDDCDDSEGYDLAHRKAISPLGQVYLDARASWADRDTSDGHKHNHALRLVGKAILKDLYNESLAAADRCSTPNVATPQPDLDDIGVTA